MNNNRIRYKQRDFQLEEIDVLTELDWSLEKYGCGPTSIANILKNYGFEINPIDIVRKILFGKDGNFDTTYLRNKGINYKGLIYCLDRLIEEDKLNISYEVVKIDFCNPNNQKQKIIDLIKQGNMAIIHVGPSEISQLGMPFDYDTIIKNMIGRKDSFNFLFIKN